jgi:hypothetical protein
MIMKTMKEMMINSGIAMTSLLTMYFSTEHHLNGQWGAERPPKVHFFQ